MSLKEMLEAFIRHRREVVTRRTIFDLRKARERAHILEGLAVALANIDEMIALIKASPSPAEARERCWRARGQPGSCARCWRRPARDASRRKTWTARCGLNGGRLPAVRGAGAGDPRHAPAPPDRAGAGQDHRRVQGAAGDASAA